MQLLKRIENRKPGKAKKRQPININEEGSKLGFYSPRFRGVNFRHDPKFDPNSTQPVTRFIETKFESDPK